MIPRVADNVDNGPHFSDALFIRAEIVAYDDLMRAGSIPEARKAGTVRMEGKTYIVRDGDVCHFLFNV